MIKFLLGLFFLVSISTAQEGFLLDTVYKSSNSISVFNPGTLDTPVLHPRTLDKPLPPWGFDTRYYPNSWWQQAQFWEDHVPQGTGNGRLWFSRNYVDSPWLDDRLLGTYTRLECVIPNISPYRPANFNWKVDYETHLRPTANINGAVDIVLSWELANCTLPIDLPPQMDIDLWLDGNIDFSIKAPYGYFYNQEETTQLNSFRMYFLANTDLGIGINTYSDNVELYVDNQTGLLGKFNMKAWVWFFPDKGSNNLWISDYDILKYERNVDPLSPVQTLGDIKYTTPYNVEQGKLTFYIVGQLLPNAVQLSPGYYQAVSIDYFNILTSPFPQAGNNLTFSISPPMNGTYYIQAFQTDGTFQGTTSTQVYRIN